MRKIIDVHVVALDESAYDRSKISVYQEIDEKLTKCGYDVDFTGFINEADIVILKVPNFRWEIYGAKADAYIKALQLAKGRGTPIFLAYQLSEYQGKRGGIKFYQVGSGWKCREAGVHAISSSGTTLDWLVRNIKTSREKWVDEHPDCKDFVMNSGKSLETNPCCEIQLGEPQECKYPRRPDLSPIAAMADMYDPRKVILLILL